MGFNLWSALDPTMKTLVVRFLFTPLASACCDLRAGMQSIPADSALCPDCCLLRVCVCLCLCVPAIVNCNGSDSLFAR